MTGQSVSPTPGTVVDARVVLRLLARRRRTTPSEILFRLYLLALFTVPLGYVVAQTPGAPLGSPTAISVQAGVLAWGPVVAIAALAATARFAAWAGIVVPDTGEVAWVVSAPVPRAALLRPRLARAVLATALVGALVGYVPALLLAAELDVPPVPVLAAGAGGGAGLGLVAAGLVWWIQGVDRRAVLAARLAPWVLVGAIAIGAAAATWAWVGEVLRWSGPWGWALLPLAGTVGAEAGPTGTAAALLAAAGVVIGVVTVVRADAVTLPAMARRALPVSGVRAALFNTDPRFAASLRRESMRSLVGVRTRRLPRPRRAWAAVPWADALGLLRAPRWLVTALVTGWAVHLTAAVDLPLTTGAGHPIPGLVPLTVALLGGMVAATQVVDGLRAEHDSLAGRRLLGWSSRRLFVLHLVTPAVTLVVTVGLAAAVVTLLGTVSPGTVAWASVAAILAVPVLLGCTALSVTTPPLDPVALVLSGDLGASVEVAKLFLGPQLAVVLVGLPAVTALAGIADGATPGRALGGVAVWSVLATVGLAAGLRHRLRRLV